MKKILPLLAVLALLAASCSIPQQAVRQPQQSSKNTNSLQTTKQSDYSSSDSSARNANRKAAEQAAVQAPTEWGKLVKIEPVKYPDREYRDVEASNLYEFSYSNFVRTLFQTGIDTLYWIKKTGTDSCGVLWKKYKMSGLDGGKCNLYTQGFYNFKTKTTLSIKGEDFSFISTVGEYKDLEFPLLYSLFTVTGSKAKLAFSPKGNYFAMDVRQHEACVFTVISTKDGSIVQPKKRDKGFYRSTDEVPLIYSCDPMITFSGDEQVIAIQGVPSLGYTCDCLLSEFSVIRGGNSFDLFPLLLSRNNIEDGEWVDVKKEIIVVFLDNNSIKFKIPKTTKYLKAGSYEYIFTTRNLVKT